MAGMVWHLSELPSDQWPLAGGKAGTLARLYRAGYPVPAGFVVMPAAFRDDDLLPQAWAEIQSQLDRLGDHGPQATLAVRSSALAEDSARASFAGEFETVLGVAPGPKLREAIGVVRESRHSERVQTYSRARRVAEKHEMAVVVQRQIQAEFAGVLFTADPVSGSHDQMVGNYVHGLGDKLVSGEITPLEFALHRPNGRFEGPPEMKRFARRLFKLAKRLERDLAGPQDIEWAIARGRVHILQSRPITSLQGFDPLTGEYNDTLTGDYVWSCVNLGEAVSVVMTPFTWSMMETGFRELSVLPGHAMVGNIAGRLYQNSTVGISVLNALGKDFVDMAKEMGGVRDEYLDTMNQYMIPLPDATFWAVLPHGLKVRRKEKRALRNEAEWAAGNPAWCETIRQKIQHASTPKDLARLLEADILPRSLDTFWRTYATALRYSERVGPLRRQLIELVGIQDADALLSGVSDPDQLLASLGPMVGLARVARDEMSREEYLQQWGHRGTLEIEVMAPRPAEDPDWLENQLQWFNKEPIDVEAMLRARKDAAESVWQRFEGRYPKKAKAMGRQLSDAAEAARLRETARSESTRLVWTVRDWVLRCGELTGIGDGAFFLTMQELADLLSGKDAPSDTIPARRQTHEKYKTLPPLPMLIRGRFDPIRWAEEPNRNPSVFDSHGLLPNLTVKSEQEDVLLGMPGSSGQAEGIVRCLAEPKEGDTLEPGDILVASQTNIGWTLLFPRAGAIVTDIGAPLSHAAIVARELGIPAVVNCGDATSRLRSGDRVWVDGTQGTVRILERVKS